MERSSSLSDRRVPPLPGELQAMNEPERTISLKQILNVFDDGIKEEQTWAVTYQTIKEMKEHHTTDRKPPNGLKPLRAPDGLNHILISTHGRCYCSEEAEIATDNIQAITGLGETLFECLDYGLDDSTERNLSDSLENLITSMLNCGDVSQSRNNLQRRVVDEGDRDASDSEQTSDHEHFFEEDSLYQDSLNPDTVDFDRILNLCKQHIGRPERADEHYRACSRALVANAFELRKFLEKINSANLQLRKMQKGDIHQQHSLNNMTDKFAAFLEIDAGDLDTSAWANLWMNVMKELRDGVTLRNCEKRHSPTPKQYSMTPYEMLMNDIKSGKWDLNKTEINGQSLGELPPGVRKHAHKIIMDFIKSRPPLQPNTKRHLKPKPKPKKSFHEQLMDHIRKPSSRALLNKQDEIDRKFRPFQYGEICDSHPKELVKRSTSSPSYPDPDSLNQNQLDRPRFNSLQAGQMNQQKQKLFSDFSGRITDTDEDDTSDLDESYQNDGSYSQNSQRYDQKQNNQHQNNQNSHSFQHKNLSSNQRSKHYDPSMDIHDTTVTNIPSHTPSNNTSKTPTLSTSKSRKILALEKVDSWNSSASSSRRSSLRSPTKNSPRNDFSPRNSFSPRSDLLYVNPALVESCGNLLGKTNLEENSTDFSPTRDRSISSPQKGDKSSPGKENLSGFFKRSYTVHGLSSAARKLRRSFRKDDKYDSGDSRSSSRNSNRGSRNNQDGDRNDIMNQVMPKSQKKMKNNSNKSMSVDVSKPQESHNKSITMHHMWAHPVECLSLKLSEVKQIRVTLTEGDVEKFRHQKTLHSQMIKGKICFVCKIRKFGLFTWSYKCPLCDRNVCYRCLRKGTMPNLDAMSNSSSASHEELFLNLQAHAVSVNMEDNGIIGNGGSAGEQSMMKGLNSGEFKACLDCAEMLSHIRETSRETIDVAHAFQAQIRK
jgi:spire-like protein